ncbi:MAG: alpha/beta hydrolase [Caulobacterales bacterium]|nr:alpha/beta hydrolase [Caulobacterales bacterium]
MQLARWMTGACCALAAMSAAPAGAAPVAARIAPKTVRADVYPRPVARFAGGVVGQADVEYANLSGYRPLTLDLYRRARPGRPAPLVIWIHGGGWNRGDSRTSGAYADWPGVLASLAARGFVVASVNYRLSGEARFPAQIQDVKAAIRFLRANAVRYGIDPSRVYAWGGSAGGHLAALAATSCGVEAFAPVASTGRLSGAEARAARPLTQSDCVQGAAIWYGIFDLADVGKLDAPSLLGCAPGACAGAAAAASPVTYVDPADPPMLLIHGLADTEVSPQQTRAMAQRLRAAGVPVETLFTPGVDHGWIGTDAAATRAASLQALQRTFDFFDAQARPSR